MEEGLFIGIDVACAKGKVLPVAALKRTSGLVTLVELRRAPFQPPTGPGNLAIARDPSASRQYAQACVRWLKGVEDHFGERVVRIAVDAPSAPCPPMLAMRTSEVELMKAGISFIKTPSASLFESKRKEVQSHLAQNGSEARLPGANLWWMQVGFSLFDELRTNEFCCIETYPQAILRHTGYRGGHKHKSAEDQLRHVRGWNGLGEIDRASIRAACFGSPHDRIDALMSAWVASLSRNRIHVYGNDPEDQICVPNSAE